MGTTIDREPLGLHGELNRYVFSRWRSSMNSRKSSAAERSFFTLVFSLVIDDKSSGMIIEMPPRNMHSVHCYAKNCKCQSRGVLERLNTSPYKRTVTETN